jgi:hypothetical protein
MDAASIDLFQQLSMQLSWLTQKVKELQDRIETLESPHSVCQDNKTDEHEKVNI